MGALLAVTATLFTGQLMATTVLEGLMRVCAPSGTRCVTEAYSSLPRCSPVFASVWNPVTDLSTPEEGLPAVKVDLG